MFTTISLATIYFTLNITGSNLRKYEVVHSETQRRDNWCVETRRRQSGKLAGSTYTVWTSPSGTKYYSKTKAIEAGFKDDRGEDVEGEKPKKKARTVRATTKRPKKD